ncbi:unnamed protein product [Leptosia nina]|uniref:Uncharacterized protein n=1 Tax=Leptosia nina TaxID=320188 RepID=A0AAV1JHU8_9NEOP
MLVLLLILPILSCVSSQCLGQRPLCNCQQDVPCAPSLSCLQPSLTSCGLITEVPMPTEAILEIPFINSMLPAASPISAYANPFSPLFPSVSPCDCGSHFLKKIPIPPPFI